MKPPVPDLDDWDLKIEVKLYTMQLSCFGNKNTKVLIVLFCKHLQKF